MERPSVRAVASGRVHLQRANAPLLHVLLIYLSDNNAGRYQCASWTGLDQILSLKS